MRKRAMALVLAALLPFGCATLERGPMQQVVVESEPAGAAVETERCGARGSKPLQTPVTLMIPRRVKRCTVLLFKEGYVPERIFLERRRAPDVGTGGAIFEGLCGDDLENCDSLADVIVMGFLGGILFGVSKGADAIAGANYQLEPRHAIVKLEPLPPPAADPQP